MKWIDTFRRTLRIISVESPGIVKICSILNSLINEYGEECMMVSSLLYGHFCAKQKLYKKYETDKTDKKSTPISILIHRRSDGPLLIN